MRRVLLLLLALPALVACHGGMAPESVKDVEDATRTSAMADRYRDAGDPASDLNVATHCALQAVIRNEKLAPFDSGIPCP